MRTYSWTMLQWAVGAVLLVPAGWGCSDSESSSPVGPDVERDGWLDVARVVSGDGETRFVSDPLPSYRAPERGPDQPPRVDAPPGATQAQIEGDRLYAISIYRGLVLADVANPAAPRIEGSFAFSGDAREFSVEDGRVLLLVNGPPDAACATSDCAERVGRVLSLDARSPGDPTLVSEQVIAGTIVSSHQSGGVLYVMSRDLEACPINADCLGTADRGARLTALTRDSDGVLRVTGALEFPAAVGEYIWGGERLYWASRPPADGPSSTLALQVIDVSSPAGVPRLAARIQLESPPYTYVRQIEERENLLYVVDGTGLRVIAAPSPDELTPLGALTLAEPGHVIEFTGARAFAYRYGSPSLLAIDLADPANPAIGGQLELQSSIRYFLLRGDRALAFSDRAETEAAVPAVDVSLLDTATAMAPRVLDAIQFGAGASRLNGLPTALDGAGTVAVPFEQVQNLAYYGAPADECPEPTRGLQLIGYAGDRLQLGAVAAQPDTDSSLAIHAGQLLGVSHISLQSYPLADAPLVPSLTAASARVELTQATARLRVLGDVALRLGLDWSRNELSADVLPTASLDTPLETSAAVDVPTLLGIETRGCSEQRGWGTRALTQNDAALAIIPRFHRPLGPSDAAAPFTLTLHGLDVSNPAAVSSAGDVQLEPLAPGEQFLGVLQTQNRVLVARGRTSDAADSAPNADRGWYPYSAFPLYVGDPTSNAGASTYLYGTTPRLAPADSRDDGAEVRYDVIDWTAPAGVNVTARVEIPEAWAVGGWGSILEGTTLDTPWGWSTELAVAGPVVVNGDIVVSQHSEPARDDRQRFFLDRLDVSDPAAPRLLPPVNIPGAVLHFDAATGELVTLEYVRFTEEPSGGVPCESRGYLGTFDTTHTSCAVVRRLLNSLVLEGDRAVRKSQLLLDTDRRTARIAVSGKDIYYVTEPLESSAEPAGPANAEPEVTLERVELRAGQLERAPSIDLTGQHRSLPHAWQQFAARDGRVFAVSGTELGVLDTTSDSPALVMHELSDWGCPILEAAGDDAYCVQGPAGVERIALEPR